MPYAAMSQLSGLAEVIVDSGRKATPHQQATFGDEPLTNELSRTPPFWVPLYMFRDRLLSCFPFLSLKVEYDKSAWDE